MSQRVVYKFILDLRSGEQEIVLPITDRIVHVTAQDDRPCFWVETQAEGPVASRYFYLVATGGVIPYAGEYRGTVHIDWTVWHLYETTIR